MRFKAKLVPEQVSFLHSVIVPLSKLIPLSSTPNLGIDTNGNNIWSTSNTNNRQRNGSGGVGVAVLSFDDNTLQIACKGSSNSANSGNTSTGINTNSNSNSNSSATEGIITYTELSLTGKNDSSNNNTNNNNSTNIGIFVEHRIESTSERNRIVMEIDLHQFRTALKSMLTAVSTSAAAIAATSSASASASFTNTNTKTNYNYVVIKLAKRQNIPCLCFDASTIVLPNGTSNSTNTSTSTNRTISNNNMYSCNTIEIHHTIPVRIIRSIDFDQFHLPPTIPLPDIQIELISSNHNHQSMINDYYDQDDNDNNEYYNNNNRNTNRNRNKRTNKRIRDDYDDNINQNQNNSSSKKQLSSTTIVPLRTVIDRLRSMSPIIYLEGTSTGTSTITTTQSTTTSSSSNHNNTPSTTTFGDLNIRIHTDGASIRTYYGQLQLRPEGCKDYYHHHTQQHTQQDHTPTTDNDSINSTTNNDNNVFQQQNKQSVTTPTSISNNNNNNNINRSVRIKVDSKKLYTSLQWQNPSTSSSKSISKSNYDGIGTTNSNFPPVSSALLCLVENEMLVIHVTFNPTYLGFITYYVPVHYVSPDNVDE